MVNSLQIAINFFKRTPKARFHCEPTYRQIKTKKHTIKRGKIKPKFIPTLKEQ